MYGLRARHDAGPVNRLGGGGGGGGLRKSSINILFYEFAHRFPLKTNTRNTVLGKHKIHKIPLQMFSFLSVKKVFFFLFSL